MNVTKVNLLSVVVPCYNEEEIINKTIETLTSLCRSFVDEGLIRDYELIFVDDGSTDKTMDILKGHLFVNNVKIVSFRRNFGHQAALVAGVKYAKGEAVVTIDADLQDPPDVIEEMIQRLKEGCDVVYGVRKTRRVDSFFKRATAKFFYKFMSWMGVDLVYNHADFRLMNRFIVNEFLRLTEINIFIRGIIPYLGGKRGVVYYDRAERMAGETKYPLRKMISFAWDGITSFSYLPLRIAAMAGVFVCLMSLLGIAWVIYLKIIGISIPGWASIIIPVLLLGGIQLLFLGLIGEYIGKIYKEIKRRPLFIVKETFNIDDIHHRSL
jgi:glycosyltransferase involved in cell wall biosynthesis